MNDASPTEAEDADLQEWSRHYDTLQWIVVAIVTAGVGGLLTASLQNDNKLEIWPEMAGLAVSVLGVFWVAGFRFLRGRLHLCMGHGLIRQLLLTSPGSGLPHQWTVFVLSFLLVDTLLLWSSGKKLLNGSGLSLVVLFLWPMLFLVCATLLFLLWRVGKPQRASSSGILVVKYLESGREVQISGDPDGLKALSRACIALIGSRTGASVPGAELTGLLSTTSLSLTVTYLEPLAPQDST